MPRQSANGQSGAPFSWLVDGAPLALTAAVSYLGAATGIPDIPLWLGGGPIAFVPPRPPLAADRSGLAIGILASPHGPMIRVDALVPAKIGASPLASATVIAIEAKYKKSNSRR